MGDICLAATNAKLFKSKMKQSEIARRYECHLKSFILYFKRPLSSFENPRFQNEILNLVLKQRPGGTQKRSINILRNSPWNKILANILLLRMFMEDTINLFNHLFVFWLVIIVTFKRSYTVVICLLSLRWIVSWYKTYIVCSYF